MPSPYEEFYAQQQLHENDGDFAPWIRTAAKKKPAALNEAYIGEPTAKDAIDRSIPEAFEHIKNHALTKDATISDLYTLWQRTRWYEPSPKTEELYAAALHISPSKMVSVSRSFPLMMQPIIWYAMNRAVDGTESTSYACEPVSAEINGKNYSLPTGDQNNLVIEIGIDKTIQVQQVFHFLARAKKDRTNSVIFMLEADWQSVSIKVWGGSKGATEAFLNWLDAIIDRNNFLRGAKIDGKGKFLRIDRNIDWPDVILPPGTREKLEREILGMFKMQHVYAANNVPAKAGLALLGPPGTGKTTLIRVLANKLNDVTFIVVSPDSVCGAQDVRRIYDLAQKLTPTIVTWEDADIYLGERNYGGGGSILTEIMNILDGVVPLVGVVTCISTNRPETLDQAIINRPGRIDVKIYLGPPDEAGRFDLLSKYLRRVNSDPKDVKRIACDQRTEGFTGAYLAELAKRAIKLAISEGRFDKKTFLAHVVFDDLSNSANEIVEERKINGDYTKMTTIVKKEIGIKEVADSSEDILEALSVFSEAASPKRIGGYIKTVIGDADVDFEVPMSRNIRSAMEDMLKNEKRPLRRLRVKSNAIKTAGLLLDDDMATLEDLVVALSGGD